MQEPGTCSRISARLARQRGTGVNKRWLVLAGLAAAALIAAGCSSSGNSGGSGASGGSASGSPANHFGNTVKVAKIAGAMVLTDAKGFTLYWFAPDTKKTSKCNASCAAFWPPLKGPVTASGSRKAGLVFFPGAEVPRLFPRGGLGGYAVVVRPAGVGHGPARPPPALAEDPLHIVRAGRVFFISRLTLPRHSQPLQRPCRS